ncbi:glycoside hydrolase family 16 protein [Leifsonia sp. NPDC058230]|uniref:glycoside hydrolase family 16 protein n=1 Tax=Leifsonia sp. NPDC058230 TaxID=3346391 RepID=UPI0036DD88E1
MPRAYGPGYPRVPPLPLTGAAQYGVGVDAFATDFPPPHLVLEVWTPSYLPAWSSRLAAAADYTLTGGGLRLSISPGHPRWCADTHEPALRVSAVQSANWSGPVGSTLAPAPFREGLTVREQQPTQLGLVRRYGRVEVDARARIGPRSMFSAWMIGLEDRPERCGELCLVEVFGDGVRATDSGPSAGIGSGVHRFRDPALPEDFAVLDTPIDVAELHTYAIDWRPDAVDFFLDGAPTRRVEASPDYPMMLILGVFDFPASTAPADPETPSLTVAGVRWF